MMDGLLYWTGALAWGCAGISVFFWIGSKLAAWWILNIGAYAEFVRFLRDRESKRRGERPSRGAG